MEVSVQGCGERARGALREHACFSGFATVTAESLDSSVRSGTSAPARRTPFGSHTEAPEVLCGA